MSLHLNHLIISFQCLKLHLRFESVHTEEYHGARRNQINHDFRPNCSGQTTDMQVLPL